jgi:predicted XRE-type DNA-binding protein
MEDIDKPIHSDTEEYSDTTKEQQLQHINSKHRAMMRYLIAGKTVGEIANIFGITQPRVSTIINSPLFRAEREKMEKEVTSQFVENEGSKIHTNVVREMLQEEALKSLNKIIELRDGATSERVRQLSALEILDRAGYKAAEKIEGVVEIDASEGLVNAIQIAVREMQTKPTVSIPLEGATVVVKKTDGKLK